MLSAAALILCAFVGQAPALADDSDFSAGRALYDDLEPAMAVEKFEDALAVEERSDADRAIIYVWLGLAQAQLMDIDATKSAFRSAVALDVDVGLPGDPAPMVAELMDEARTEVGVAPLDAPDAVTPTDEGSDEAGSAGLDGSSDAPHLNPDAGDPPADGTTAVAGQDPEAADDAATLWWIGTGVAAGVALVSVAASAVFGAQALSIQETANQPGVTQVDAAQFRDQATTNALAANVLLTTAALSAAAGAGLGAYALVGGAP